MLKIFLALLKDAYENFGILGVAVLLLGVLIMLVVFDWVKSFMRKSGSDPKKVDVDTCSKHRDVFYKEDRRHNKDIAAIQERLKDLPEMKQDIKEILVGVSKINGGRE